MKLRELFSLKAARQPALALMLLGFGTGGACAEVFPAAVACSHLYEKHLAAKVSTLREYDPQSDMAWAQYIYQMARARVPFHMQSSADPFFTKAGKFVTRNAISAGRALTPIPLPMRGRNEVESLFVTLWKNPGFEPSAAELELLRKNNAEALFLGRKRFLLENPKAKIAKNALAYTRQALTVAGSTAAIVQAFDISKHKSDVKDFLKRPPEDEAGKPVVQLLVETVPFPHTALRIGHKVYSYGQEYMTAKSVGEYMSAPANSGDSLPLPAVTGSLGLAIDSGMPRSVRVTNLNFSPEVVAKLQRDLEMNTGKIYRNETMVNDCATMIKRALEESDAYKIPALIDAFPSVSSTYLSLRGALGDKRIGATELVTFNPKDQEYFHNARNTYIAMLEAKALSSFLLTNSSYRAGMEAYFGKSNMQYYVPEVQAEIDRWKADAAAEVQSGMKDLLGTQDFFDQVKKSTPPEREKRLAAAKALLNSVSERMARENDETINFSGAEFQDVIKATEKNSALRQVKSELEQRLNAAGRE